MAAVTSLGVTFDTADGTKTVVATPALSDLIVIVTGQSANISDVAPSDNNAGGGGTYSVADGTGWALNAHRIQIAVRDALITSATSTTFTHAPGTTDGGGLVVLAVSGMTKTGSLAAKRTGVATGSAGTTPTVTWGDAGTPAGTNPMIGAVMNGTNPATLTKPATFDTELHDVGFGSPARGLEVVKDDTGNTDTTVTWGSTSSTSSGTVILELDAVAVGGTTPKMMLLGVG